MFFSHTTGSYLLQNMCFATLQTLYKTHNIYFLSYVFLALDPSIQGHMHWIHITPIPARTYPSSHAALQDTWEPTASRIQAKRERQIPHAAKRNVSPLSIYIYPYKEQQKQILIFYIEKNNPFKSI